jgi:dTDP-4-dehydrorhamnose reductase
MRLLLTGASGQLGGYLLQASSGTDNVLAWTGHRGGTLLGHRLDPVDLADPTAVAAAFDRARPDVVVHAAAWARVADCFRDPDQARRVNVEATALLCDLAAEARVRAGMASYIRVPDPHNETDVSRALESGAEGLVLPEVHSVDDINAAAKAAFFPPKSLSG